MNDIEMNLRDSIKNFGANYLNREEWLIQDYWALRISKIQFFTKLLLNLLEKKIDIKEIIVIFEKLKIIEDKLAQLSGDNIKKMQQTLMNHYNGDSKIGKPLKNKPVKTIFYRLIGLNNYSDLLKIFEV